MIASWVCSRPRRIVRSRSRQRAAAEFQQRAGHPRVHPLETVAIAVEVSLPPVNVGDTQTITHVAEIGENIYRPMLDGPWEGHDAREVLTEAIEWWEQQLTSIDRAVERRRTR